MSRLAATVTALVVAVTLVVNPVAAQTGVRVEVPAADYSFGQHITFHLEVTSPTPVNEVNLFFRIQGQSETIAVPVPIEPGSRLFIDYAYSMVGQDVPPFATITYWWEIRDENGDKRLSEEQWLYYADNRYDWRVVQDQRQGISWEVFWVQGDVVFGQTALNTAIKALDDVYPELSASAPGFVRIFIYPSETDLHSALNLAGYNWAGGLARPELGVILVGIPDNPAARGEMERLIPHELTHLLVYEATGRTLGQVPPWLNEGLATLNERRPDPNRQVLVEQALAQDRLFPLEVLCAPFPADESAARLAYAQSASVVQYLRENYGSQVIRDLLAIHANSTICETGVNWVLDTNLEGLDSAWRAHLVRQKQIDVPSKDGALWIGLWLLTVLLALPLLGFVRSRRPDPWPTFEEKEESK